MTLPDKTTYQYKDVIAPPKYLTHATGVNKEGTPLSSWKAKDIDALFDEAGVKDVDQRKAILRVSAKEGGFNAINTWDTGFVSVGAIQFTTGPDGNYNIAKLLQTAKTAVLAASTPISETLGSTLSRARKERSWSSTRTAAQ